MKRFHVPSRGEVSANNQNIFDNLQKNLGFVPNLYATMAYSDTGLENYLHLQNAKTSLSKMPATTAYQHTRWSER